MRINSINNIKNYDTHSYNNNRNNVSFKHLEIFLRRGDTQHVARKYDISYLNKIIDSAGESIKNLSDSHVYLDCFLRPKVAAKHIDTAYPHGLTVGHDYYEPPFQLDIISPTQIRLNGKYSNQTFNYEDTESMKKSYKIMTKGKPEADEHNDFILTEDLLMSCCEVAKNIQKLIDNFRRSLCKKEFTNALGCMCKETTNYDLMKEYCEQKLYVPEDFRLHLKTLDWDKYNPETDIVSSPAEGDTIKTEQLCDIIERNYCLFERKTKLVFNIPKETHS